MRSRYNTRLIRKRRTYTVKEISALYGLHTKTVQRWISYEHLSTLAGSASPYLIYGETLASFLTIKKQQRKCPLQEDEFYCLKCRCARKSLPSDLKRTETDTRIGNKWKGVAEGKCQICGSKMYRFFTYERERPEQIN